MLLAQNMCLHYIKTVLEVCMQCLRTEGPFNTFQMQDSPSVVLRGTRLWSKPEDLSLQSPCSSQNAMKMEHLPRSVSNHPRLFPSLLNLSRFIFLFPLVSCVPPPLQITPKLSFFFTDRKVHPLFFIYTLMCFTSSMCLASAGPVPYSDRLLLVCYQWWQASEWLLCAQQDPSVFRY